ncbi:MAG TPA: hypothetical protein VHE12_09930 [bacterium]|nr:hypothetical protein [bacterium]
MKRLDQKGEGMVMNLILLAVVVALGYVGYVYLWPMVDKPGTTQASNATPVPGKDAPAGSPAAGMVQGAEAAGDVLSSGR